MSVDQMCGLGQLSWSGFYRFRTTPQAVNKVLDEYATEVLGEPNLKRSLMLELTRLDRLRSLPRR